MDRFILTKNHLTPRKKKNNNNNMDGLWRFNITRTQFCLSLLLPAIKHGNGKSPIQFAGFPIEMQIYSGFLIQPCLMTPETYPHKIPMIPSMFHDWVLSNPSFSCPSCSRSAEICGALWCGNDHQTHRLWPCSLDTERTSTWVKQCVYRILYKEHIVDIDLDWYVLEW